MSDEMKPALTAEEWAKAEYSDEEGTAYLSVNGDSVATPWFNDGSSSSFKGRGLPALIALANAALSDDDPRKFTREKIELLRGTVDYVREDYYYGYPMPPHLQQCYDFLDALESYLPPKP